MLVVDPLIVARAIGAKCGGSAPSADNEQLNTILNLLTPRLEDALNVVSLVQGTYVDHFTLPHYTRKTFANGRPNRCELLLSNGFIARDSIIIVGADVDGTMLPAVNPQYMDFDYEKGLVVLEDWHRGRYMVTYQSGFPVALKDDGTTSNVLADVPDWMTGILVDMLIGFYRANMLSSKVPDNISYAALDNALRRDLYARIYGRYMRPRVGVTFTDKLEKLYG